MQPFKIFRLPSTRKQLSWLKSTTYRNVITILTSTSPILMTFLGPENHHFRASSSRGVARTLFGRGLNVGYHGCQRKLLGF